MISNPTPDTATVPRVPTEADAWKFDAESRDVTFNGAPVFRVYEADDFPCIEDEDRAEAWDWYDAQGQTIALVLNAMLHFSGDTTPIPMPASPVATPIAITREEEIAGAFEAGCRAVHDNYQADRDPDFTEATNDYVKSLNLALLTPSDTRADIVRETVERCAEVAEKWKSSLRPGSAHRLAGHEEAAREIAAAIHVLFPASLDEGERG